MINPGYFLILLQIPGIQGLKHNGSQSINTKAGISGSKSAVNTVQFHTAHFAGAKLTTSQLHHCDRSKFQLKIDVFCQCMFQLTR